MRPSIPALTAAASLVLATLAAGPASGAGKPEADVYDITANEAFVADPFATLQIRLDRKPTKPVTITWRTADGTATAGADYERSSGKVVLARGQRTRRISVPILTDDQTEATEFFHVRFTSKQAKLTRKRATVSIIDDDVPPYSGQLKVSQRWEQDANGFYSLETWTLTFRPRLVPADQGTAWYDDGLGEWELTGSRVLEDRRPGAGCRVVEKETYSGGGVFFTEPHPDTDVAGTTGNLVLQNFFPQQSGNHGFEPLLHVVVSGHTEGTSYVFDGHGCEAVPYENEERFALEEAPGEVERDSRGQVLIFDHYVLHDNSAPDVLDTYQLDVVGELTASVD